ncbi:MAG TPA: regulatory protein RecX [Pseudonocardia sp.]
MARFGSKPGGGRSPGPGADPDTDVGTDPDADPESVARAICLQLLTDRSRTRQELSQAMRRRGVAEEVAARVLKRFGEVGLIDDQTFADQWVRSRHQHRGLGRRAIAVELHRKGVAKETADEALDEIDPESERLRATELVRARLRTMAVDGPDERAKAGRRLLGMLARKGYPGSVAYQVVRAELAAQGADEDELGPADLG